MNKIFRVLLIDDNQEVLDHLKRSVERQISIDDLERKIEVVTLNVELELDAESGIYQVSESTIRSLAVLCNEPFDFIFTDFAYLGSKEKNEELRDRLLSIELREATYDDIDSFVRRIEHIVERFEKLRDEDKLPMKSRQVIESRFINYEGLLYIITFSPKPFDSFFSSGQQKLIRNRIIDKFPNIKFDRDSFILLHEEYSITPEIRNQMKQMGIFRSALISTRIANALHIVALEDMVRSQSNFRFKRVKVGFRKLMGIGVGFAFLIAFFGKLIFVFTEQGLNPYLPNPSQNLSIVYFSIALFLTFLAIFVIPQIGTFMSRKIESTLSQYVDFNEKITGPGNDQEA